MQIIGKWALVTGASSGLGVEFARILAEKGCHLVLVARRTDLLEEVKRTIQGHYENSIELITCDLSQPGAAQRIYDDLTAKKIQIDILVNNAGFGLSGGFFNFESTRLQNMIDLNIKAVVDLAYIFGKDMCDRKFGYILNVASTAAFQPLPYFAIYGSTKSFVLNFSEALHAEFKKNNVVVTCLCPGVTKTEFFKTAGSDSGVIHWFTMKADVVCKQGIDGLLNGKLTVVTGFFNKILSFIVRLFSRRAVLRMSEFMMKH